MIFAVVLHRDFFFFIIVFKQKPVGNSCERREGRGGKLNCTISSARPLGLHWKCCGVSRNAHQSWQLKDLCVFVHMCNSPGRGGVTGVPGFGEEQLPHGFK